MLHTQVWSKHHTSIIIHIQLILTHLSTTLTSSTFLYIRYCQFLLSICHRVFYFFCMTPSHATHCYSVVPFFLLPLLSSRLCVVSRLCLPLYLCTLFTPFKPVTVLICMPKFLLHPFMSLDFRIHRDSNALHITR